MPQIRRCEKLKARVSWSTFRLIDSAAKPPSADASTLAPLNESKSDPLSTVGLLAQAQATVSVIDVRSARILI